MVFGGDVRGMCVGVGIPQGGGVLWGREGLFLWNGVVVICGLVDTSSEICGFEVLFCLIHRSELDIGRIEGLLL